MKKKWEPSFISLYGGTQTNVQIVSPEKLDYEVAVFQWIDSHLYADSISAWSNQGSIMCLLSILNQ